MLLRTLSFLTIFIYGFGECYKLLMFFPFPAGSHYILGEALVNHLLEAGHEITYVTRKPMKNPPARLHQVHFTSDFEMRVPQYAVMASPKKIDNDIPIQPILNLMLSCAESALLSEEIQNLILDENQQFDAVIAEWMFTEVYAGLSTVFNCPLIWSSTMIPHSIILSTVGVEINPAYTVAQFASRKLQPLSFWDRINELYLLLYSKYYRWKQSFLEAEVYYSAFKAAVEKRGRVLPSYFEAKYNASLILGNSHVSTSDGSQMPLNYIPIAGYHINTTVEPLPRNLQEIMDNATRGVIFFSMGSLLTSDHIPNIVKQRFADMFSTLNYTVLWKLDEGILNSSRNVHVVKWAPQQSILAHPNCKLFITHGGLLSVTEAVHFAVPIIGLPVFGDQYNNVNRAVARGYGIKVQFGYDCAPKVKEAILEIMQNISYSKGAKAISFVYHHRPVSPAKELVHWVEHVVNTNGALHLRFQGLYVPWYQKMFLDVIATVLFTYLFIYCLVRYVLSYSKNVDLKLKIN